MTQNTSHAVMAQRHEANDSLEDFPTQCWGTRALCIHVLTYETMGTVWDPACNRGYMARPLADYFDTVIASDVHDYGHGYQIHDFLQPYAIDNIDPVDWVITNPPFRLAEQFITRSLQIARRGVAMLVRTSFIESVGRYDRLFRENPPAIMAQFSERLPLVKGRVDRKASTATSYCWLVWLVDFKGEARLMWIPPCRSKLERDSDYEVAG